MLEEKRASSRLVCVPYDAEVAGIECRNRQGEKILESAYLFCCPGFKLRIIEIVKRVQLPFSGLLLRKRVIK